MSETKSIAELSAMSALAFKNGDFQMSARIHAQAREQVEPHGDRALQLDDGSIVTCTREELAAADTPEKVNSLHNDLRKRLAEASGSGS